MRSLRKMPTQLHLANLALMALVCLVLHRLSCSNETVREAAKHEFWVQWSGSGALVAKT
jgi:hypothetical protein